MKMKRLIYIPFLFITIFAQATTYWVTPRGNDSNTGRDSSSTGAWLTWQKAFNTAVGHDTVYFRGGTYATTVTDGNGLRIANSGTAGNYICFWAYQPDYEAGNYPTLDCDASGLNAFGENDGIRVFNRSYLYFKGLQVMNVHGPVDDAYVCNGIAGWYGTDNKYENCIVHDIDGVGFAMFNFTSVYLVNCDAYLCGNVTNLTLPGASGTGIALVSGPSAYHNSYGSAIGCRAWQCSDQGFTNGGGAGYVVFENCWAWDNGNLSNNLYGNGSGFKYSYIWTPSTTDTICLVKNCIAAKNLCHGFTGNDHYTWEGNYITYNCFSYDNGDGWENLQQINPINEYGYINYAPDNESPGFGRVWRNNLSYNNHNGDYYNHGGTVTTEYNSWNNPPSVSVTASDFQSLDYTQLAGARGSDGSLPTITFGKLSSTSDCIDAGVDVGIAYNGDAPDLGWSEYIYEEEPPASIPLVSTIPPISITSRYASSGGTAISDGGAAITVKGICWSTSANPTTSDTKTTNGTGEGDFNATITGLLPNTSYHVRAYATNSEGTGYGADEQFTTDKWNYLDYNGKIVTHGGKSVIIR